MKAFYTGNGRLIVREGGIVLFSIQVPAPKPRALADDLNERLKHIGVSGDTPADWKMRAEIAKDTTIAAIASR